MILLSLQVVQNGDENGYAVPVAFACLHIAVADEVAEEVVEHAAGNDRHVFELVVKRVLLLQLCAVNFRLLAHMH